MAEIVESNLYRCTEHCPNCPFLDDGNAIHLKEGRVDQIKEELLKDDRQTFLCHKTVYNLDNEMEGTEEQQPKMCYGAYLFLKKEGTPNVSMRLEEMMDAIGVEL